MPKLVLVRHGESLANAKNIYTGWNDVPLSQKGIRQAHQAAKLLAPIDFSPTWIHTSILMRAIKTANILAADLGIDYLPITKTWRLNERHYGALRGINKDDSRVIFGDRQVQEWRRSFYAIPPLLAEPVKSRCYEKIDPRVLPRGESLFMASQRILPYYQDQIATRLRHGEDQLVVAHGSSLRALVKYLERISDAAIDGVEVHNATPIVYELDENLKIMHKTILK